MNLQYITLPPSDYKPVIQDYLPIQDLVNFCWERELMQFIFSHYLPVGKEGFRCMTIGDVQDELYQALQQVRTLKSRLEVAPQYIINEKNWELFMALSLSHEEVESLNEKYNDKKKVRFFRHDYRQGLGLFKYEKPFDWYWLGTEVTQCCSKERLAKILSETLHHAQKGSIVCLDFVGKYGIGNAPDALGWDWQAVEQLINITPVDERVKVKLLQKIDRSIHLYGNLRQAVQDLFTPFVRTDLQRLYLKAEDLPENLPLHLHHFFATLQNAWNSLVYYVALMFEGKINAPEDLEGWEEMVTPLKHSLKRTQELFKNTEWMAYGDVRANILEPHLAYALRHLEYELQEGLGAGQFFTVLLQVNE